MKILWLKTELLHPVDKGGRIRTYQMLRALRREHEITYLSLVDEAEPAENHHLADEYCHKLIAVPWRETPKGSARFYRDLLLNQASALPYAVQKYRSSVMQQAIRRELREGHYDLLVCDFLTPSVNLPEACQCATVLFQHNFESLIWQRLYETARSLPRKLYFHQQWRRMLRYERAACRRFEAVVAVSRTDRDLMRQAFGLSEIYDVPTGVDTEYFSPARGCSDPLRLVFTGSMDWLPNEDAIVYFAERILPHIAQVLPGVVLTVVGRNPSPRLMELSKRCLPIFITGRVDDVRPHIDRAAAYIVPLRIGGGTRLKIFEAMAMGKPVISTSIGAEGLPVRDGAELLIADEPEAFAHAVIRVLTDQTLAREIGQQARVTVSGNFSWESAAASFARICERTVRQRAMQLEGFEWSAGAMRGA